MALKDMYSITSLTFFTEVILAEMLFGDTYLDTYEIYNRQSGNTLILSMNKLHNSNLQMPLKN